MIYIAKQGRIYLGPQQQVVVVSSPNSFTVHVYCVYHHNINNKPSDNPADPVWFRDGAEFEEELLGNPLIFPSSKIHSFHTIQNPLISHYPKFFSSKIHSFHTIQNPHISHHPESALLAPSKIHSFQITKNPLIITVTIQNHLMSHHQKNTTLHHPNSPMSHSP